MEFKKGDRVKLPFNERGTVVKVNNNLLWGFKYDVKIRVATLSTKGEIADFREDQMELEYQTYTIRPWNLVPCPNLEKRNAGSSWCKTDCEFNSKYFEIDDHHGRTDFITFTCKYKNKK